MPQSAQKMALAVLIFSEGFALHCQKQTNLVFLWLDHFIKEGIDFQCTRYLYPENKPINSPYWVSFKSCSVFSFSGCNISSWFATKAKCSHSVPVANPVARKSFTFWAKTQRNVKLFLVTGVENWYNITALYFSAYIYICPKTLFYQ